MTLPDLLRARGTQVHTGDGQTWDVERVLVCSGVDFRTLFPEVFATAGIRRCKLQMMRTVPQPAGFRLVPTWPAA